MEVSSLKFDSCHEKNLSGLIVNFDQETSMPAMSRTPKTRASAPPKPSTLCFTNLPEASTFSEGNHYCNAERILKFGVFARCNCLYKDNKF